MLTRRRALSEKAQLNCETDGQPAYRLVAELVEELQWLRADRAEGVQAAD